MHTHQLTTLGATYPSLQNVLGPTEELHGSPHLEPQETAVKLQLC